MEKDAHNCLYRSVLDACRLRIQDGTLAPGTDFPSCAALVRHYGIPRNMAYRVQQELQDAGYILPRKGTRFLINAVGKVRQPAVSRIRRIRIIGSVNAISDNTYGGLIVDGIRAGCLENGLEFHREFVHILDKPRGYINSKRTMAPDEGLILMLQYRLIGEVIPLLLDGSRPIVMVNSFFPRRSAVLPDYRLAARELLKESARRDAHKAMFCTGYEFMPCPIIAEEQSSAFEEYSRQLNMQFCVERSGNYLDTVQEVNRFRPDVMFFHNDNTALHFRDHYLRQCEIRPRIVGCDNYANVPGLETLTTWDTDPFGMGHAAVEVLLDPKSLIKSYIRRIKGRLVVRN